MLLLCSLAASALLSGTVVLASRLLLSTASSDFSGFLAARVPEVGPKHERGLIGVVEKGIVEVSLDALHFMHRLSHELCGASFAHLLGLFCSRVTEMENKTALYRNSSLQAQNEMEDHCMHMHVCPPPAVMALQ